MLGTQRKFREPSSEGKDQKIVTRHPPKRYTLPEGTILNEKSLGEFWDDVAKFEKIGLTEEACWAIFHDENFPITEYRHLRHQLRLCIQTNDELFTDATFINWVRLCVVAVLRRFQDSPNKTKRTGDARRLGNDATPDDVFTKIKNEKSARGTLIHKKAVL
jgi:hypothetical protein